MLGLEIFQSNCSCLTTCCAVYEWDILTENEHEIPSSRLLCVSMELMADWAWLYMRKVEATSV